MSDQPVHAVSAVPAPSRLLTALELRAVCERAAMAATSTLLERLPRGDGHPVVVLPGFTADDLSTDPLRKLLDTLGYNSYGWRLGTNLGPTKEIVGGLLELIERITRLERQPMSIVGWSLGGIYGREIARQFPDRVRQVITLGSPLQMVEGDRSATSSVWESLRPLYTPISERPRREAIRPPVPVPTTAVYTRTDGIVHWETCLDRTGPTSENVEVYGSHCGLGFNPTVLFVVSDRLSQPKGAWRPFRSPVWLRGLYPPAARLDARFTSAAAA